MSTRDILSSEFDKLQVLASRPESVMSLDGEVFASVPYTSSGGRRVVPYRDPMFQDLLAHLYAKHYKHAPRPHNLRAAVRQAEASARIAPDDVRIVHRRVAAYGRRSGSLMLNPDRIVIDLNDGDGRVIDITGKGWQIASGAEHMLLRSRHMIQMPEPQRPQQPPPESQPEVGAEQGSAEPGHSETAEPGQTGVLERFRKLVRPASNRDWVRLLTWIGMAMRGFGPLPAAMISSTREQDTSAVIAMLRSLVDPAMSPEAPNHRMRDEKLLQYAHDNWVVAFDGVSRVSERLGTMIRKLSSGTTHMHCFRNDPGGAAPVHVVRPVLLGWNSPETGIPARMPQESTMVIRLEAAESAAPRLTMGREFSELRPALLGVMAEALSTALARLEEVECPAVTRLADAALWMTAAAPALGLKVADIIDALSVEDVVGQTPGPPPAEASREGGPKPDKPKVARAPHKLPIQESGRTEGPQQGTALPHNHPLQVIEKPAGSHNTQLIPETIPRHRRTERPRKPFPFVPLSGPLWLAILFLARHAANWLEMHRPAEPGQGKSRQSASAPQTKGVSVVKPVYREPDGAGGGGRTLMPSEGRGILSPVRLPIPPLQPVGFEEVA